MKRLLLSIAAAGLTALWALPAAYASRGYHAVGGEWLLIISVGFLAYRLVSRPFCLRRRRKEAER